MPFCKVSSLPSRTAGHERFRERFDIPAFEKRNFQMNVVTGNLVGANDACGEKDSRVLEIAKRENHLELKPRALAKRHALQTHLAAIVESSDDAIISKSLDGTILSWNKAAERILGYSARNIIGCSIRLLIPPDRQDEETRILRSLQGSGERVEHLSTVRLAEDGSRIDVEISISPIRDGSGRIVGASKILRGMDVQRQADQDMRDSEARLRGVVDSASDVIITTTELGCIESVNQAGILTFGYRSEELIGQQLSMLIPGLAVAEHGNYPGDFRCAGEPKAVGSDTEVIGRRKDGRTFPADIAVSEVLLGNCKLFTAIVRDITQRKEVERALVEAKEAAEAASKAKEHFLSALSHELRTPLTPALAEISFLEQDTALPIEMRDRLKMVRRNLETEARLVDDLLDITRITQGKIHLRFEIVNLHDVLRAALGMFQAAIDARMLEVNVALHAKQHHTLADPGRTQQILLNLISNAVKFTPANGRISIRSCNSPDGMIEIEVGDSGVGIEPDLLSRIFKPFEQGDRTRQLGGLGLGLSIARSLAESHLGKLTASSDGRNRGSTFRLSLAVAPPPVAHFPPAAESGKAVNSKHRILVVEDHDDTRTVMARLLKNLGHHVTVAANVREALESAEAAKFDLLISDIGLPDGSGLDVMRKLKSKVSRGIAISGFGQEDDVRRSSEAGFALHITKPVNFDMLKEILKNIL
jgi:two-component system, chemotaxis family, CheB/CheR fusion protein